MVDTSRTTTVIFPDSVRRITQHRVGLPHIQGVVHTMAVSGEALPRNQSVVCVPFTLPPPSDKLYGELSSWALHRPELLSRAIKAVVAEWTTAQAVVQRAGVSGNRSLEVEPYPSGQSVSYVLKYACTEYEFFLAMGKWPECAVCFEQYVNHVDNNCCMELGGTFTTAYPSALGTVQRIVEFNNELPRLLVECADSIYSMALERLNGQQKTGPFTGDSAGRKFTAYVNDVSTRIAGATSDGPSHPVSGEPGDHGDR